MKSAHGQKVAHNDMLELSEPYEVTYIPPSREKRVDFEDFIENSENPIEIREDEMDEDEKDLADQEYEEDESSASTEIVENGNTDTSEEFACPVCSKLLVSRSSLRNHMLVHSERNIICDLCGALFRQKSVLWGHKQKSHNHDGTFFCNQCSCRFENEQGLKNHKRRFHGPESLDEQLVKFRKKLNSNNLVMSLKKKARLAFLKSNNRNMTKSAVEKKMTPQKKIQSDPQLQSPKSFECSLCAAKFTSENGVSHHLKVRFIFSDFLFSLLIFQQSVN